MNEVVPYIYLSVPFLLALLIPIAGLAWAIVGARVIWFWVALYFSLLFFFPNVSWGLLDSSDANNFYNRATGTFFFSAINIFLFGLSLQAFSARRFGAIAPVHHNMSWPALIFALIFLGNILIGIFVEGVRWYKIIGYSGLLNVFNFMLAFYVMMSFMREQRDLERLINILLLCAVIRGVWGVVRFFLLGGDPANFYANFQRIDVTLTFFDINDSLVAVLALFIVAWRVVSEKALTLKWRITYYTIAAMELFIIVFSYRRTAWGGLVLAALLFAFTQRQTVRNRLLASYILIGLPALAYKSLKRSGPELQEGGFLERLLPDVFYGGTFNFTSGRFAELYAAALSIKDSPLFGLGAWGEYSGFRFSELYWHKGDFAWMHSGFLHIALKSGLIGAITSIFVIIAFIRFIHLHKNTLAPAQYGIMMTGLAGLLFMLPNWLIGTPVIEYRTMQLMAFSFALPYLAVSVAQRAKG